MGVRAVSDRVATGSVESARRARWGPRELVPADPPSPKYPSPHCSSAIDAEGPSDVREVTAIEEKGLRKSRLGDPCFAIREQKRWVARAGWLGSVYSSRPAVAPIMGARRVSMVSMISSVDPDGEVVAVGIISGARINRRGVMPPS